MYRCSTSQVTSILRVACDAAAVEKATPFEFRAFQAWVRMDVRNISVTDFTPKSQFQTRIPNTNLTTCVILHCFFIFYFYIAADSRTEGTLMSFAGHLTPNRFPHFSV